MAGLALWGIACVVCGAAGASMLSRFGKEGTGFLLGLLLGPIGLIIAWTMRDDAKLAAPAAMRTAPSGLLVRDERECPYCAELILRKARVCKHCGRDVEPLPPSAETAAAPASDLASLRRGLFSPDPDVRFRAADAIGDLGAAASDALADLGGLFGDPDGRVRQRARWAVEEIRDKVRKARRG